MARTATSGRESNFYRNASTPLSCNPPRWFPTLWLGAASGVIKRSILAVKGIIPVLKYLLLRQIDYYDALKVIVKMEVTEASRFFDAAQ